MFSSTRGGRVWLLPLSYSHHRSMPGHQRRASARGDAQGQRVSVGVLPLPPALTLLPRLPSPVPCRAGRSVDAPAAVGAGVGRASGPAHVPQVRAVAALVGLAGRGSEAGSLLLASRQLPLAHHPSLHLPSLPQGAGRQGQSGQGGRGAAVDGGAAAAPALPRCCASCALWLQHLWRLALATPPHAPRRALARCRRWRAWAWSRMQWRTPSF